VGRLFLEPRPFRPKEEEDPGTAAPSGGEKPMDGIPRIHTAGDGSARRPPPLRPPPRREERAPSHRQRSSGRERRKSRALTAALRLLDRVAQADQAPALPTEAALEELARGISRLDRLLRRVPDSPAESVAAVWREALGLEPPSAAPVKSPPFAVSSLPAVEHLVLALHRRKLASDQPALLKTVVGAVRRARELIENALVDLPPVLDVEA
jgi:hypothetical protein